MSAATKGTKVVRGSGAQKPPRAGMGRPKGTPNKTTTALKEAILLAAEEVGQDGEGSGGLTGYLRRLALDEPRAYAGLLGKVLPLQVTGADGKDLQAAAPVFNVTLTTE